MENPAQQHYLKVCMYILEDPVSFCVRVQVVCMCAACTYVHACGSCAACVHCAALQESFSTPLAVIRDINVQAAGLHTLCHNSACSCRLVRPAAASQSWSPQVKLLF
jgi:hypothetical protein